MAATVPLREALNQGISSGSFVDTKIILYSYRDSSRRVCRPKALYVNSHVLKKVPHFTPMFDTFKEPPNAALRMLLWPFAESKFKDFKEEIEEESAEDYGYLSDSDLEDDEDARHSPGRANSSKVHPFDPFPISGEEKPAYEKHDELAGKEKVIKIPDMAFVTFQAFVMYLYTGAIEFAPFGSEENRRSRSAEIVGPSNDKIVRPSPKSIYRLADKYDIPELRTLALNHIHSELGKCDVAKESFGRFASQYAEVRDLYVKQLTYLWVGDSTGVIRTSVNKRIDSFVGGDLKHATKTVSALWKIAAGDGNITAPLNASPAIAQVSSPAHWDSVRIALVKSVRTGVFFDRKYWARHNKDLLKPVYFSSTIMSDKAQQLNKLVKYIKDTNTPISDLEGSINVESDCEEDFREVLSAGTKQETGEKPRAVLVTGSFAAWKSLFFYRCTDRILFAPLKSQGVESRSKYIRDNAAQRAPLACSPKTIYVLASLLEIQPLCDTAFADIRSKLTGDNVVEEVFSWVTATQERIMEMECELLTSSFNSPTTIDLVDECIERISDGAFSHSAEALKLGLKKAFDLKKRKNGALLRCPHTSCTWHINHVSYSSVGTSAYYCQMCIDKGWGGRYLQCADCGYTRTSNYALCQGCGGRFV